MEKIKDNHGTDMVNNKLWLVYLLIISIILTPDVRIAELPALRLEQLIVIAAFVYFCINAVFLNPKTTAKSKRANLQFAILFFGFSLIILLSIMVGALKGVAVVLNDFYEIYKVLIYLGVFLLASSIVKDENDKQRLIRCILICLLISVLISVQQYFDLFDLNEKYIPYIAPTQYSDLISDHPRPRVVGITGNPNEYAVMVGTGAIIAWSSFLLKRKIKYFALVLIFILGIFLTGSRSGFAFMAVGILMFTIFYFFRVAKEGLKPESIKFALAIVGAIIFLLILIIALPENLTYRFRGFDLKLDTSFQARLANWKEHFEYFKISPILGLGPAKSIKFSSYADNEWLFLLRRYGLVGTIYFVFLFIFPFLKVNNNYYKYLYFSVLAGAALYMVFANIYHNFQVMSLIMLVTGLAFSNKDTKQLQLIEQE